MNNDNSSSNNDENNDPLSPEALSKSYQNLPESDKLALRKTGGVPSPDVRSQMAKDALKNSKFGAAIMQKRQKRQSELVHEFLESKTRSVLQPYITQIREARRNGFGLNAEIMDQISEKLYADVQMAFASCGREELHIMLSTVLLGIWMEALDKIN